MDPRANFGAGCDCQARLFDAVELIGPGINAGDDGAGEVSATPRSVSGLLDESI